MRCFETISSKSFGSDSDTNDWAIQHRESFTISVKVQTIYLDNHTVTDLILLLVVLIEIEKFTFSLTEITSLHLHCSVHDEGKKNNE